MDTTKVLSQLDQLDDEIDDLEESLAPLLKTVLSETASKLPLLDKAKLYTLVTYAIESMLFSYLRLNGVKARDHPVFTELTRVKQYFDKIKTAETPVGKRQNLSLDKKAAARIITAGLSGNDKYDLQRAEQQAKERARAHMKFNELTQKMEAREKVKDPQTQDDNADSSDDSEFESSGDVKATPATPKKRNLGKAQTGQDSSTVTAEALKDDSNTAKSARKRKKAKTEKTKA